MSESLIKGRVGFFFLGKRKQKSKQIEMISIKRSCTVKPAEPTPNVKLWLSECDQVKPSTLAPVIYFYRPVAVLNASSALSPYETLKQSLCRVLVQYHPFAGRLNDIGGGRFELHCNAAGVELIEAESEGNMEEFGDLRKLAPQVDYSNDISELPLTLVQVTRFKCGGISIGTAISHILIDGQGAIEFINYWAKTARGEEGQVKPFHDRTVFYKGDPLAKPRFDHIEFKSLPTPIGQNNEKERKIETKATTLKLTKDQVEKLKKEANEGRSDKDLSRRYSRYEVIAGHIWRCASRARKLEHEQITCQRVAIDCRKRLNPPLPAGYYGNAVMVTIATALCSELFKPSGFTYGCSRIRAAVEMATEDYIKSAIDFLASQQDVSPFRTGFHVVGSTQGIPQGSPNLTITSWLGIPIYGADFGWGRPFRVGHGALGFDGKAFAIPGDGDGSFTIPIRLQLAHMDDFKKFFYDI